MRYFLDGNLITLNGGNLITLNGGNLITLNGGNHITLNGRRGVTLNGGALPKNSTAAALLNAAGVWVCFGVMVTQPQSPF